MSRIHRLILTAICALALAVGLVLAAGWTWQWHRARQQWQRAQDALRQHDLAAAATCLERYLQYRPDADPTKKHCASGLAR